MAHYFVSDVHAGLELDGVPVRSGERLVGWLDAVAPDADAIYLLGDIFDFWFEYKRIAPAGHESVLHKFRELSERGIGLHFFPGNHDMWTLGYLSRECGVTVHDRGLYTTICGRKVYMEHGDIQSVGSFGERLMQGIFRSRTAQGIARTFVPYRRMMAFGNRWSRSNRAKHSCAHVFREEQEGVVRFAREYLREREVDVFVFGHLHAPASYPLNDTAMLYVLGDWILEERLPVYGRLDDAGFFLEQIRG